MAINAMAIDIVIPALLLIGEVFSITTENNRQWLVTAYLLPFGIGQLLFGTLADVFGRKRVILAGLGLYGLASLATPFATDFSVLLILRGCAGLGAAAARVAVMAMVRDCFSGRDMAAVMSIVMMVFMAIPIFAPWIGQMILLIATWKWIFLFMAFFAALLVVWVSARLPETLSRENRRRLTLTDTIESFHIVLSTRRSLGYSIALALFFGCLFGFINASPQIYLGIYDLGDYFPLAFSLGGFAVASANLVNSRIVRRLGMRRASHSALCAFLALSCMLMFISSMSSGPMPLWLFLGGTATAFAALGFIGTNFNAITLEPLGEVAGTATAAFGFIQTAGSATIGAAIGQTFDGTVTPILGGFVVCSIVSLGFVFWAERGRLFTERESEG